MLHQLENISEECGRHFQLDPPEKARMALICLGSRFVTSPFRESDLPGGNPFARHGAAEIDRVCAPGGRFYRPAHQRHDCRELFRPFGALHLDYLAFPALLVFDLLRTRDICCKG